MPNPHNEGFRRYTDHQSATDPAPFRFAADMLDEGADLNDALAVLTPRHLTTLFHVEKRPPAPMLEKLSSKAAAGVLRNCADELDRGGEG